MALLGNYSVLNKTPGRYFGGTSATGGYVVGTRANWGKPAGARFSGTAGYYAKSPTPDGYRPPYCWVMARKSGALAAHTYGINGTATVAANLAGGKNATADLSGLGVISNAPLQLIVSASADLSGSGTITAANLVAVLNASADLTGSGTLAANVSALASMLAALSGTGTVALVPYAIGHMQADITPFTELSPENLAAAVWAALAAENNDANTMGELLNDAGGGSSPGTIADAVWDELMAGHTTDGSYGDRVQDLLTIAKFLGLK